MNWEQNVLKTISACVNAATEHPDDIVQIFHWATVEGDIDDCKLVKALVESNSFDVNRIDYWPNNNLVKTSLLLSSAEFRNEKMVNTLLELGADTHCVDENGFGIADMILWGHDYHDQFHPDQCINLLQKLTRVDKAYKLQRTTITLRVLNNVTPNRCNKIFPASLCMG